MTARAWTPAEWAILDTAPTLAAARAVLPPRMPGAVVIQWYRRGRRQQPRMPRWTAAEDAILRAAPDGAAAVAALPGRTAAAVQERRRRVGPS